MIQKNFIVFEGIDGSGTSTQIELLKKRDEDKKIFFTAEPTEGETGKFLRKILGGKFNVAAQTAAYLFAADRAEHLWADGGIVEQCEKGKIVVCDRYIFSSLAYQGATCGDELPKIINSPFPLPEMLFFFDIKSEDSLKRIDARGEDKEIYENKKMLEETAIRYKRTIEKFKSQREMKIIELDATLGKEEIAETIWNEIRKKFLR